MGGQERELNIRRIRHDLSRIKWIYKDQMDVAKLLPNPSSAKKHRARIARKAEDLLAEMKKVTDWSFLQASALAHRDGWLEERALALSQLQQSTTDMRNPENTEASSAEFLKRRGKLQENIGLIDAHIDQLFPDPERIGHEIVSRLEVLVSLLKNPVPDNEDVDQKYRAASANRWLAEELRTLAEKYVSSRAYTLDGPAMRFAAEAAKIIVRSGMTLNVLREHWMQQDKRA
jgi:hypothetical protein